MNHFFTIGASALGALGLWIPSGYAIGALALLVGSFVVLARRAAWSPSHAQWAIVGIMLIYSTVWMADGLWRGEGVREMDQASRVLLAVPVLLAVTRLSLSWSVVWVGVAIGGIGSVAVAWVDVNGNLARASGYIGPEPFGHVTGLLSGLSLIGVVWFAAQKRWRLAFVCAAGASAAVGALVLSGTRAAWLGFILVMGLLVLAVWVETDRAHRLKVLIVALAALLVFGSVFAEPIGNRIKATHSDLSSYFSEDNQTQSVGNRFRVWAQSLQVFAQKPFIGWGSVEYRRQMALLDGADPAAGDALGPRHAHNEVINALAKKGVIGGVAVVLIFLIPALAFAWRLMRPTQAAQRLLCWAGLILVVNSGMYGMAHTALENNAGVMNYAFWLALLAGSALGGRQFAHGDAGMSGLKT